MLTLLALESIQKWSHSHSSGTAVRYWPSVALLNAVSLMEFKLCVFPHRTES